MTKPYRVIDATGKVRFTAHMEAKAVKRAGRLNSSSQPELVAARPFQAQRKLRNGTWELVT